MPYKSLKQMRFFHSPGAKKAGISKKEVKEFDKASKGKDLPEHMAHGGEVGEDKMDKLAKAIQEAKMKLKRRQMWITGGALDEIGGIEDHEAEREEELKHIDDLIEETKPAEHEGPIQKFAEGGQILDQHAIEAASKEVYEPKKKHQDDKMEHEQDQHYAHGGEVHEPKLGSGKRFEKLEGKLEKKGAEHPAALAAWIGRKKFGPKKFSALSHHKHMEHGGEVKKPSFLEMIKARKKR